MNDTSKQKYAKIYVIGWMLKMIWATGGTTMEQKRNEEELNLSDMIDEYEEDYNYYVFVDYFLFY